MSRVVRASKYRHVFGENAKKENVFDDLKPTKSAWDSNYVAVNPLFWAALWDSAGGGSFAVGRLDKYGKLPTDYAGVINGHKDAILDLDWHPHNDNLIATVSEDCYGKVWSIPSDGVSAKITEATQQLKGHKRKIGTVQFNPIANHILATSAADMTVKVWDIESGQAAFSNEGAHGDLIQSCSWNHVGTELVTTCKDKKLRTIDPRSNKICGESIGHEGVKGSRAIFLGDKGKIFSVGFSKSSQREYALWDVKDLSKPLVRTSVDTASGMLIPTYDNDTSVLFLAGRGDGNIRYFEIANDDAMIYPLSEYKSATPLKGIGWIPKRAVNVSECEIARAYKLTTKTLEPISFIVPRKSDMFQDDIFPDCFSGEASLSAKEWLGGANGVPKTHNMEKGFVQKEKKADFNPVVAVEKELTPEEMKAEIERLTARVNYLEAENVKKDAKIKELSS